MSNIYESMNVMQKLAKARLYFLNSKVSKSGKNMMLEFKYFELEDIVPTAIRIFSKVGLLAVDDLSGDPVSLTVFNADNPGEAPVIFRMPYREQDQIINKSGKAVTNPLQALGSSVTYLRRYLWMIALDITEPDSVDPALGEPEPEEEQVLPKPKKSAAKPPATPAERKEAKEELVKESSGNATEDQINLLKSLCRSILAADETKEEFVNKIALETNGFTEIETGACSQLCEYLQTIVDELGGSNE